MTDSSLEDAIAHFFQDHRQTIYKNALNALSGGCVLEYLQVWLEEFPSKEWDEARAIDDFLEGYQDLRKTYGDSRSSLQALQTTSYNIIGAYVAENYDNYDGEGFYGAED